MKIFIITTDRKKNERESCVKKIIPQSIFVVRFSDKLRSEENVTYQCCKLRI